MFNQALLAALFASIALTRNVVRADPNPSEPGPGDSFNEGSTCHISWEADTTGVWKEMNIELMSGSNLAMNHITTVATVDGTDTTKTTFDYPCPEVTPNSAIYFYQFTSPASTATYWTTRFTIADSTGKSTAPANAKQTNGDPIPWGVGALVDPSLASAAPAAPGSGATGAATASVSASAGTVGSTTASSPAATTSSAVSPSTTASSNSTTVKGQNNGATTSTSANSTVNGAAATNSTAKNATVNGSDASGAIAGLGLGFGEMSALRVGVSLSVMLLAMGFAL